MNAGSSGVGQAFALRNCDAFFTASAGSRAKLEENARHVGAVKEQARALGRDIEVYSVGQVVCRPTQGEADDYYRHAMIDHADWEAVDGMLEQRKVTRDKVSPEEYEARRRYTAAVAIGGYPFVGTPDKVADELANLNRAGLRGIAVSFVNYLDELPYFCEEVLPRLERMGLRGPH
jgi:alkanesulfonate monooxygenase SsuD/methylene tetrahydromethanopterin reductase-like flavin-dependent oxidoreductase (luciferase family)